MHQYERSGTIGRCTQRHQCHQTAQGYQPGLQVGNLQVRKGTSRPEGSSYHQPRHAVTRLQGTAKGRGAQRLNAAVSANALLFGMLLVHRRRRAVHAGGCHEGKMGVQSTSLCSTEAQLGLSLKALSAQNGWTVLPSKRNTDDAGQMDIYCSLPSSLVCELRNTITPKRYQ